MINYEFNCLIISAGFSERMKKLKPLMLYDNVPFIINIIFKTASICDKIYIVLGYHSEEIKESVMHWFEEEGNNKRLKKFTFIPESWQKTASRIQFIYNPTFQSGMFNSIQQGLTRMNKTPWILFHLIDQPHIPPEFYFEFSRQRESGFNWIQPRFQNKKGHPVIFDSDFAKKVIAADANSTLKEYAQKTSIKKKFWNCNYPQILNDFDTPDDLLTGGN